MSAPRLPVGPHDSFLLLQGLHSGAESAPQRLLEAAQQARHQAGKLQQTLAPPSQKLGCAYPGCVPPKCSSTTAVGCILLGLPVTGPFSGQKEEAHQ